MEIRKKRHATFLLNVHLIFIIKYRKKVLFDIQLKYLEELFIETLEENDCKLIEFNGELDHVHLIISYEPKHSISQIVNNLKGRSSRLLKRDFPDTAFNLGMKSSLWTRSYFAGSVGGVGLDVLKKYIENQDRPKY